MTDTPALDAALIDAAARAICVAHGIPPDDWDEDEHGRHVEKWEHEIGAAIAVLSLPTAPLAATPADEARRADQALDLLMRAQPKGADWTKVLAPVRTAIAALRPAPQVAVTDNNSSLRDAAQFAYQVMADAFARIHSLPRSSDSALATRICGARAKIEAALADAAALATPERTDRVDALTAERDALRQHAFEAGYIAGTNDQRRADAWGSMFVARMEAARLQLAALAPESAAS